MQYKEIILEKQGHIATLIFNRPGRMNAVTLSMGDEILRALAEISDDHDVRVLILSGAGENAFCAGGDVEGMGERVVGKAKGVTRHPTDRIGCEPPHFRRLRVPTIAAVNVVAAGLGLSFALACDIRIASDNARFRCAWINVGLVPDGGATYFLSQLVGVEKALALFYTGDIIDAQEALRIGLVSDIVPHGDLMKVTGELAERLAAAPPIAIQLTKSGVYRRFEADILATMDYESYAQSVCLATEDHKEAVKSFLEKSRPEFKGR